MPSKLLISTCFSTKKERTIEQLSKRYSDLQYLKKIVGELMSNYGVSQTHFLDKSVLLKPNWVRHNMKLSDEICLTTHPNFIIAVLEIILAQKPKKVIIADAPVQGCEWECLITEDFRIQIQELSDKYSVPISIVDLRRTVFTNQGKSPSKNTRDISNYVIFDLGNKSYLEPITTDQPRFRVTDYDPNRLSESHNPGMHKYCIAKELFEADCVVALPKAKTHQKAGITNALKLVVGFNGDKDFLPHHRVGGTGSGGDCYPGANPLRRISEYFLDKANRNIGGRYYRLLINLAKIYWKISLPTREHHLSAGWYGNDTTWRMVMDLNIITKFGMADGRISDRAQRSVLYICDGIIGGQGDGPLRPEPLPLGVVMISEEASLMDYALTLMMGFPPEKIPLINAVLKTGEPDFQILYDDKSVTLEELSDLHIKTLAPQGWDAYLRDSAK